MTVRLLGPILTASLLILTACSNDDDKSGNVPTGQIEFEFVFPEGVNTKTKTTESFLGETPWLNFTSCTSGFDEQGIPIPTDEKSLKAHIKLEKKNKNVRTGASTSPDAIELELNIVIREDKTHVTEPITLDANTEYQLTDILVKGTDPLNPLVHFSGVNEGSELAAHVTHTLPHTFTVLPFEKHHVEFPVLCARGLPSNAFGKPKFSIQDIEISCIPIFVDICNKDGESFVANGNLILKKLFSKEKPSMKDFERLQSVSYSLQSGEISYLCFSDNLNHKDIYEWQLIEINYQDPDDSSKTNTISEIVSLDAIKNYQQLDTWNDAYKFLDISICNNKKCIFLCNQ